MVNWALTTLMDGKGKFWEIVSATAFALIPMFLIPAPLIVISNYITSKKVRFTISFRPSPCYGPDLILFGA